MTYPIESIVDFPVPIAQPAAGAGFVVRPNQRGLWRVLSIAFDLTTSAVPGNRVVSGAVSDGTSTWQRVTATATQAASLTVHYSGFRGTLATAAVGTHAELSWPDGGVVLFPGYGLTVNADGIDAGDQFSNICALVEELPDGRFVKVTPVLPAQIEGWNDVSLA